jgi:hypothetical protein
MTPVPIQNATSIRVTSNAIRARGLHTEHGCSVNAPVSARVNV